MTVKPGRRSAAARAALAASKATLTPTPPPPPGAWRKLADGWHVELVPGATRTRCNQAIPSKAQASAVSMPTHCDACRLHFRAASKAAADG